MNAHWDLNELAVFAGKHNNVRSFVHGVLHNRAFRDGQPPQDGWEGAPDTDRAAWLSAFWDRLSAAGLRGYRAIEGADLPAHYAAVASAIGAVKVAPGDKAISLRTADNGVFLDVRVNERALVIGVIGVGRERRGLGTQVCAVLADWAAERGLDCGAVLVTNPGFFRSLGWENLGGAAWKAPARALEAAPAGPAPAR